MIEELEAFSKMLHTKKERNRRVYPILDEELADRLTNEACAFFQVDKEEVFGKSRKAMLALCRHVLFYKLSKLGFTFRSIGIYYGGRDHATVIHGVDAIENYLSIPSHPTTKKINTILNQLI